MEGKMPNAGNKLVIEMAPWTNGDAIRDMTDEELAEFLNGTDGDFLPTGEALTVSAGKNRWLDWLRQEVADGEQS